jgi:hypothetical protein
MLFNPNFNLTGLLISTFSKCNHSSNFVIQVKLFKSFMGLFKPKILLKNHKIEN